MVSVVDWASHEPYIRYAKLWVAHAPRMPGTFSPPPRVSDPDMHHGTCLTHVPWCMPGSLTSGIFWGRWRGKRSRHSRCMRNPQFCVSGKKSIAYLITKLWFVTNYSVVWSNNINCVIWATKSVWCQSQLGAQQKEYIQAVVSLYYSRQRVLRDMMEGISLLIGVDKQNPTGQIITRYTLSVMIRVVLVAGCQISI